MLLQESAVNFTAGANVVAGVSFLIATYFLSRFVSSVQEFMKETDYRVTRLEAHLEIKPEDVGSYRRRATDAVFKRD